MEDKAAETIETQKASCFGPILTLPGCTTRVCGGVLCVCREVGLKWREWRSTKTFGALCKWISRITSLLLGDVIKGVVWWWARCCAAVIPKKIHPPVIEKNKPTTLQHNLAAGNTWEKSYHFTNPLKGGEVISPNNSHAIEPHVWEVWFRLSVSLFLGVIVLCSVNLPFIF